MKKNNKYLLIITFLVLVSCGSHDATPINNGDDDQWIDGGENKPQEGYYINDYAYNLYDADTAPPGSFVMDWEPGIIRNLYSDDENDYYRNNPARITADFEPHPTGCEPVEWRPYKQIGKAENGRVKIVLLPLDFDSFPDEKIKWHSTYGALSWIKYTTIYLPKLFMFNKPEMDRNLSYLYPKLDLTFYYWAEDGTVDLKFNGITNEKECDVKKGWSVLIDGKLIFDPGILRHFEEYLAQHGWEDCYFQFSGGSVVNEVPEI